MRQTVTLATTVRTSFNPNFQTDQTAEAVVEINLKSCRCYNACRERPLMSVVAIAGACTLNSRPRVNFDPWGGKHLLHVVYVTLLNGRTVRN